MLLTKPFPFDIRVKKEAESLIKAGHQVTVLCRREENQRPKEVINGIKVYRHSPEDDTQQWRDKLSYLLTQQHPSWTEALRKVVQRESADAIHVHDLRFIKSGLSVGDELGPLVIADLHENYPEAVRQWRKMVNWNDLLTDPMKLADRIGFPVKRYKKLEKHCIQNTDRVITVAKEAKHHYVEDCNADPEDVLVVSNRADVDSLSKMDLTPIGEDGFLITYVGSFGPHRGLETAIRAMADISEEVPEAHLLIVGSAGEESYEQKLRDLCRSCGVSSSVTFTGWVDFDQVPSYIAASDICIVLHAETTHTETTIPHKLFQYMAYERPVIVTDVAPLKRVVRATNAGVVIPTENSTALVDNVLDLYHHPSQRKALGANGRQAVETEYNWESEADKLCGLYRNLAAPHRGG